MDDTIGATVDSKGVTHLCGNSFGHPGYNETYDYVMSTAGILILLYIICQIMEC